MENQNITVFAAQKN